MKTRYLPVRRVQSFYQECRLPSFDIEALRKVRRTIFANKPESPVYFQPSIESIDADLAIDNNTLTSARFTTAFVVDKIDKPNVFFLRLTSFAKTGEFVKHIVPCIYFEDGQVDIVGTYPVEYAHAAIKKFFYAFRACVKNNVKPMSSQISLFSLIIESQGPVFGIELTDIAEAINVDLQESDPDIGPGFCTAWTYEMVYELLETAPYVLKIKDPKERVGAYHEFYNNINYADGLAHWNTLLARLNSTGGRKRKTFKQKRRLLRKTRRRTGKKQQ